MSRLKTLFAVLLVLVLARQTHAQTLPNGIPNLCAPPIATITITSVANGNWSNPQTWNPQRVPNANDVVNVAASTTVTYDQASTVSIPCIGINGTLTFNSAVDTQLIVTTMIVMPGGTWTIPVPQGTHTARVGIADVAPATGTCNPTCNPGPDPEAYGTGILIFGTANLAGATKSPTWTRLTTAPTAGVTSITVQDNPTGWKMGDGLVIPDTRQLVTADVGPPLGTGTGYVWHGDTPSLASTPTSTTLTFTGGLSFAHPGALNAAGQPDQPQALLPHVGNLTRNVIIYSLNPNGHRGHVLATSRASVTIQYVQFQDLGRTTTAAVDSTTFNGPGGAVDHIGTNQIGRYPLHMHHLIGPTGLPTGTPQYQLEGNAVVSSLVGSSSTVYVPKWGIVIHDSHFGLIQDNVLHNNGGASVVTEDGSETQNTFNHNFVADTVNGHGDRAGGDSIAVNPGREGVGFWFHGTNNIVTNNVAANSHNVENQDDSELGFNYYLVDTATVACDSTISPNGNCVRIPSGPGLDPSPGCTGSGCDPNVSVKSPNAMPIPVNGFKNNEAYGAMQVGLTFFWIGTQDNTPTINWSPPQTMPVSTISNFTAWHTYSRGIYHYPAYNLTVDGYKMRCSYNETRNPQPAGATPIGNPMAGGDFGDYYGNTITYQNFDIQNCRTGIGGSILSDGTPTVMQNGTLNNQTNIYYATMYTSANDASILRDHHWVIKNVCFGAMVSGVCQAQTGYAFDSSFPQGNITLVYDPPGNQTHNYACLAWIDVQQFNGVSNDNFRAYFNNQQAPSFVWPTTDSLAIHATIGQPAPGGLTNSQTSPRALGGAVAPCTTTRTNPLDLVGGYACAPATPPGSVCPIANP